MAMTSEHREAASRDLCTRHQRRRDRHAVRRPAAGTVRGRSGRRGFGVGVRRAGAAARADGAGRLPWGTGPRARRRGRRAGDVPGPARRAGSIRRAESLASWLFGAALKVSARSREQSARRRALEQRGAEMKARARFRGWFPELRVGAAGGAGPAARVAAGADRAVPPGGPDARAGGGATGAAVAHGSAPARAGPRAAAATAGETRRGAGIRSGRRGSPGILDRGDRPGRRGPGRRPVGRRGRLGARGRAGGCGGGPDGGDAAEGRRGRPRLRRRPRGARRIWRAVLRKATGPAARAAGHGRSNGAGLFRRAVDQGHRGRRAGPAGRRARVEPLWASESQGATTGADGTFALASGGPRSFERSILATAGGGTQQGIFRFGGNRVIAGRGR